MRSIAKNSGNSSIFCCHDGARPVVKSFVLLKAGLSVRSGKLQGSFDSFDISVTWQLSPWI